MYYCPYASAISILGSSPIIKLSDEFWFYVRLKIITKIEQAEKCCPKTKYLLN
jgi:hypothetical protein